MCHSASHAPNGARPARIDLLSLTSAAAKRVCELTGGRVDVIDVPTSHEGMFCPPHVDLLAQARRVLLKTATDARKSADR